MENIEALPWYRSATIMTVLLSLITKVLVLSGVIGDVAPEDTATFANTLVLVIGGFADLWAMRSRVVQKSAPKIVSSQKMATLVNTASVVTPNEPVAAEAVEVLHAEPQVFTEGQHNG